MMKTGGVEGLGMRLCMQDALHNKQPLVYVERTSWLTVYILGVLIALFTYGVLSLWCFCKI